eukprot:1581073-Prymnesium_polylepis.1
MSASSGANSSRRPCATPQLAISARRCGSPSGGCRSSQSAACGAASSALHQSAAAVGESLYS